MRVKIRQCHTPVMQSRSERCRAGFWVNPSDQRRRFKSTGTWRSSQTPWGKSYPLPAASAALSCTGPRLLAEGQCVADSAPNLNSAGHRLCLFRNRHGQHAMTPARIDLLAIHSIGKDESTVEMAVPSFRAYSLDFIAAGAGRLRPLARQGQNPAIERQLDCRGVHARKVDVKFEPIGIFVNVHWGNPHSRRRTAVILAGIAK